MSLIKNDLPTLRGAAHKLKPIVLLGKAGLTEPVLAEINNALDFHELIKVKVAGEDRDERRALIESMAQQTGALMVQVIGRIAVLYRAAPPEKPASKPRPKPASKRAYKPARRSETDKPQRRVRRPNPR